MTQSLQVTVGHHVRHRRKELGLSQEKFAELVGVHRTYVGALERGERNLSLGSVERLAALMGVRALDLLRP